MKIRINEYGLNFILNHTSNEYTLQGVYNVNSYIGTISDLSQVFLAIYEIPTQSAIYTGSENIEITDNQIIIEFSNKNK